MERVPAVPLTRSTRPGAATRRHSFGDRPPGVLPGRPATHLVHRTETWHSDKTGTVKAAVQGVPGEINGRMRLSDVDSGTEWVTSLAVRVSIPLVGGKIEKSIGEQVVKLLANEATFTEKWLAHRG